MKQTIYNAKTKFQFYVTQASQLPHGVGISTELHTQYIDVVFKRTVWQKALSTNISLKSKMQAIFSIKI